MLSSKNKYRFADKEFLKILVAIVALMIASVAYYFYIRHEALRIAEKRSEITLQDSERLIQARMGKIETVVKSMQLLAEYAIADPEEMYVIARHTVEASSHIMGADIAFKEYYYPEKGRWFQAYAGYQEGDDKLIFKQLGGPDHDYTQMEWFMNGMDSENGAWSDPYYDNAGGKTFMMTYARAVRDKSGNVVGVISADVSLDTLTSIVKRIKPYPRSFCSLVTGSGMPIVSHTESPKGKCHVFTEEIDGKNMTLTLTIPDADMYKRLRRSSLVFALLALTGLLTIFLIIRHFLRNLWELNEVRMKEQHIEDELTIARNIQQSLLPCGSMTNLSKRFDISGLQIPARFVGGDLYDYYVRDDKLFFCIGDVSGKGVPSALLMAVAHSLFRTLSARDDCPARIMQALNNAICDNNPDLMFITMFVGVMDLSTGKISYCNAGHNPPIMIKKDRAEYLDTEPSLLLGVDSEASYIANELTLNSGDTLFLYTDGLTEAENNQQELFGEKRAQEEASAHSMMTAKEQLELMRKSVQQFVDNAEQSDDLTLLAIHFQSVPETLTLTNNLSELAKLEPFLKGFFNRNSLDSSVLPSVNLALEEALANVIMYAYPKGTQGEVTLSADVVDHVLCMEIRDQGIPFNPLQQQEADLDVPLEERQIGGLGIHLIKENMESLEYEYVEGENVLRMRKEVES